MCKVIYLSYGEFNSLVYKFKGQTLEQIATNIWKTIVEPSDCCGILTFNRCGELEEIFSLEALKAFL